jgi:hypothetical protein
VAVVPTAKLVPVVVQLDLLLHDPAKQVVVLVAKMQPEDAGWPLQQSQLQVVQVDLQMDDPAGDVVPTAKLVPVVVQLHLLVYDSASQAVVMVAVLHTEPSMLPCHCSQLVVQEQAAVVQLHWLVYDSASQAVVMVAELHTEPSMLPSHCYPLVVQEQLHHGEAALVVAEQPKIDYQIGLQPPGEVERAEEGVVHYYYEQQNVHCAQMETSSVNTLCCCSHSCSQSHSGVLLRTKM